MAKYSTDSLTPMQRVKNLVFSEKRDILMLVYLTLAYGAIGLATPIAVQSLVNSVTMGGVVQPLYIIGLILLILLSFSGIIFVTEYYLVELIQRRIFVKHSSLIAKNAQQVRISVYDEHNPVELVNRYFDVQTVQKSASSLLTSGLTSLLQGAIGSIVILFYSLYFAIFVLINLAVFWVIVVGLNKAGTSSSIDESEAKYAMAAWLESIARNKWTSKFYNSTSRIVEKTADLIDQYLNARVSHFKIILSQLISSVAVYAVIGTSMLVLGGYLVVKGQINLGQFVAAELIIFGVLSAYVRFISKLESYYDLVAALSKLGVLDTLPLEIPNSSNIIIDHINTLELKDVSFAFRQSAEVLKNISIKLKKGDILTIAGSAGTGKSTLIELICGMRSASKGVILYNGIDLRTLNVSQVRNFIGIANKPEWFEGSILENISLGRDIDHSRCVYILNKLGLWEDISQYPDALNTKITDFGAPLSYAQLQILMLVRAFVVKPELLVIDGLLDSLSPKELTAVIALIYEIKAESIVIINTRLESIRNRFDNSIEINKDMP